MLLSEKQVEYSRFSHLQGQRLGFLFHVFSLGLSALWLIGLQGCFVFLVTESVAFFLFVSRAPGDQGRTTAAASSFNHESPPSLLRPTANERSTRRSCNPAALMTTLILSSPRRKIQLKSRITKARRRREAGPAHAENHL